MGIGSVIALRDAVCYSSQVDDGVSPLDSLNAAQDIRIEKHLEAVQEARTEDKVDLVRPKREMTVGQNLDLRF